MIDKLILGAIAGDIIGSVYEHDNYKDMNFQLFSNNSHFTDDTILTIATMSALLDDLDFVKAYQKYGRLFPNRGYGSNFSSWIYSTNPQPYFSYGNGSAMRVSPIGWYYDDITKVIEFAYKSAIVTHNHLEGIKGAEAVACCVFLARKKTPKNGIKQFIEIKYGYNLSKSIEEIRPKYSMDVSCQGSVPQSIISFLESTDYESCIRLAISIGGDSDTIACIAGSIAEAYYQYIPKYIIENVINRIPRELNTVIENFSKNVKL